MAGVSAARKIRPKKTTGLRYWMLRVLEESERAAAGFDADAVHDLRVSLRRCRSLADGMMVLDPNPEWGSMKKAGKRLFQRLGELRDIQVMEEWMERLEQSLPKSRQDFIPDPGQPMPHTVGTEASAKDPAASAMVQVLSSREQEQKRQARSAVAEFDDKRWRRWSRVLPLRAARFRPGNALYKHLALERWTEARQLHRRALRNRSQVAFHALRIGIKRFRYVVENFLPELHKSWGDDLKEMQDLLGEVHDLDVLWSTAVAGEVFPDNVSRQRWRTHILAERGKRVQKYRAGTTGVNSIWNQWRAALPQAGKLQHLANARMKLWANALDPDFAHSERVASLALEIFDGLLESGWMPAVDTESARFSLFAAALLHDVGKSEGHKGHHKKSRRLILEHGAPLGWKESDLRRAATVARFHRGGLPTTRHKLLRDLIPPEQKAIIQMTAILRLANAMDACHDGRVVCLHLETDLLPKSRARMLRKPTGLAPNQALIIAVEGYTPTGAIAQAIATERHLLETVLRRPVLIKPAKRNRHDSTAMQ